MKPLSYRQIHLDFHTSPLIDDVGSAFNAEEFVQTLQKAHVTSINLFARCHHGFNYYPSKVGRMHPSLKFDLFGAQLHAVRDAGMRALAYTTAAWSEDTCDFHPDWMQISADGVLGSKPLFEDGFGNLKSRAWRSLCLNNEAYVDYMLREIREIYDLYQPDGFWIDIIHQYECVCPVCRKKMKRENLDPRCHEDRVRFSAQSELFFIQRMHQAIQEISRNLEIYFNAAPAAFDRGNDPALTNNQKRNYMTFIDIESLPSQEWGYSHFPVLVNYVNKYDQNICMMNGKFHQSWGDFGSLRNKAQLEYECFRALANGAHVCVGDQLHPRGKLDPSAYARIGDVFRSIEEKEPWCANTTKVANVGVIAPNITLESELIKAGGHRADDCSEGVYRILSELHIPFDFLSGDDPLDAYELLILPDKIRLDKQLGPKIDAYIDGGGKCLCTGISGMAQDEQEYALRNHPAAMSGMTPYSRPYISIQSNRFPDIPPMDYVIDNPGARLTPADGAEVLAWYVDPYFDRTWEHTCSHRQTPPQKISDYAAIVQKDHVIAIGPALFGDYAQYAVHAHKAIVQTCLMRLLENSLLISSSNLPSTAEVTLRKLDEGHVVHVLHYIPHRRCRQIDTIEDVIPLYGVALSVRVPLPPAQVKCVPQNTPIPFRWENGCVHFVVEQVSGHQMVWIQ